MHPASASRLLSSSTRLRSQPHHQPHHHSLCPRQQHSMQHHQQEQRSMQRPRRATTDVQQFVHSNDDSLVEARLLHAGIPQGILGSVRLRNPELSRVSVEERLEPLLQYLTHTLALQPADLQVMLLRCPRLFSFSMSRQVLPVVAFLQGDLGFSDAQVASTLRRFPQVLGYGVKSHLVPHCHYLKSLGLSEEDLPRLILCRPQVLGSSIELVITYLRKWLRITRTNVGRLLWSYPLDYSLPRLILPDADAALATLQDEGDEEAGAEQGSGAAAAARGQGGDDGSSRPAPLGSRERCTWLDVTLGADGSPGDSSSGGGGGSGPPPSAA